MDRRARIQRQIEAMQQQTADLKAIAELLTGKDTPEARKLLLNFNQYMRQFTQDEKKRSQ